MADFYVLVHRDAGPLASFLTSEDAEEALEEVFGDEPTWRSDLWVEPFELVVADDAQRR